jgi:hypothetical protein
MQTDNISIVNNFFIGKLLKDAIFISLIILKIWVEKVLLGLKPANQNPRLDHNP